MRNVAKWAVIVTLLLTAGAVGVLSLLSLASRRGKPPGLVNGRLAPCSTKPNCVCSEMPSNGAAAVSPIQYPGTAEEALKSLREVILAEGGKIADESKDYIATTFETGLFRFVDDVEFRISRSESVIHVRSTSRVGYSDMGANRKRVNKITERFNRVN